MLINLLIAIVITLLSLGLMLNFSRFYEFAEQAFHTLAKVVRFTKYLIETLARACRRSNRIPYYS